jgi:hypothetical protein
LVYLETTDLRVSVIKVWKVPFCNWYHLFLNFSMRPRDLRSLGRCGLMNPAIGMHLVQAGLLEGRLLLHLSVYPRIEQKNMS